MEIKAPEGIFTYQYDFQGNLTREERPDGNREYHYNALQQQMEVLHSEKSIWKNGYDTKGLREMVETEESSYHFVYNPEKDLIAEREEGKEKVIQYLYGNQEAVLAKHLGKETQNFYYAQDEQGSTVLLADEEGEIKNRYFYSAFGELLEQEEQVENRLTYTRQQWDKETEQYYLRARYYNPAVGRFVQEDAYRGDGLNLYAYCANNPVMYYDPSGYASKQYKNNNYNYQEYDIVPYDNRKYRTPGFEKHHGVLNEWAEHHIPGYTKKNAPTILLLPGTHQKTKNVYQEWLRKNYGRPVGISPDWFNMSKAEAMKLTNDMFDAANVPQNVRKDYFELFDLFILGG